MEIAASVSRVFGSNVFDVQPCRGYVGENSNEIIYIMRNIVEEKMDVLKDRKSVV